MENIKRAKIAEKYTKYAFLAIFAVITLIIMLNRQPFFDEAHAWMVSKSFSFFELFKIERFEGHLFVWHTLLMPFSKNNFLYPYSMYFMNWVFCIIALVIFWNKAPFNILEKSLITFSYPFLSYYAPVARCYSIGLLFLFLILSLWKNRLNHPIEISFLFLFFMNTSAMAVIGAFPLGIIFIWDLLSSRSPIKNKVLSFLIMAFGATLVLVQLFGAYHPDIKAFFGTHLFIYKFLLYFTVLDIKPDITYFLDKLCAGSVIIFYFLSFIFFKNSKKVMFFHITTITLLLLLFIFKYPGAWWHYSFFFIYAMVSVWLFRVEGGSIVSEKIKKAFYMFSYIILAIFVLQNTYFPLRSDVYQSKTRDIADTIQEKGFFNPNNKVYVLDSFSKTSNGIKPYFPDEKLYTVIGDLKYSHNEYEHHMREIDKETKVDYFAESLSDDRNNIGLSDRELYPIYQGYKHIVLLKLMYEDNNFKVYNLIKVN